MKQMWLGLICLLLTSSLQAESLTEKLLSSSVTVDSGSGQGSGVIITKDILLTKPKNEEDKPQTAKVNFVLTAAHVIKGNRYTFNQKTYFKPVLAIQETTSNGRKISEFKVECTVLKYSDPDTGHDLALLGVRKYDAFKGNTDFYLDEKIPDVDTPVIHIGSILGLHNHNSWSRGLIASVGRIQSNENDVEFDQVTVSAVYGCSGGGIFLNDGKYCGMLTKVIQIKGVPLPSIGYMVPIRRMKVWAEESNLKWLIDSSVESPSLEEIKQMSVED